MYLNLGRLFGAAAIATPSVTVKDVVATVTSTQVIPTEIPIPGSDNKIVVTGTEELPPANNQTVWDNICAAQIAVCNMACPETAVVNSCDTVDPKHTWSCICPGNSTITVEEYNMPAAVATCAEDYATCQTDCFNAGLEDVPRQECLEGCVHEYQCGMEGQPAVHNREGKSNEELTEEDEKLNPKKKLENAKKSLLATDENAAASLVVSSVMASVVLMITAAIVVL